MEVETLGIANINPATGETIKTFEPLTDAEVSAKLERAGQAFEQYRKQDATGNAKYSWP